MASPSAPAASIALLLLAALLSSAAASPSRGLLETYEKQECNKRLVETSNKELTCRTNADAVAKELKTWKQASTDNEVKCSENAGLLAKATTANELCQNNLALFLREYELHRTALLNSKIDDEERAKEELGECEDGRRGYEHDVEDCKNNRERQRRECDEASGKAKRDYDDFKRQHEEAVAAWNKKSQDDHDDCDRQLGLAQAKCDDEKKGLTELHNKERDELQRKVTQCYTDRDGDKDDYTRRLGEANEKCNKEKGDKDREIDEWKKAKLGVEAACKADREADKEEDDKEMAKAQGECAAAKKVLEDKIKDRDAAIKLRDDKIAGLERDVAEWKGKSAGYKDQLESTTKEFTRQIAVLKAANAKLKADKDDAEDKCEDEIKRLKKVVSDDITEAQKAKELKEICETKNTVLEGAYNKVSKEYDEYKKGREAYVSVLIAAKDECNAKLTIATASADGWKTTADKRSEDINGLKALYDALGVELANCKTLSTSQHGDIDRLTDSLGKTENEREECKARVIEHVKTIKDLGDERDKVTGWNDDCHRDLDAKTDDYNKLNELHGRTYSEGEKCKKDRDDALGHGRDLYDELEGVKGEHKTCKERVVYLEGEEKEHLKIIAEKEHELDELEEEKKECEQKLYNKAAAYDKCARDAREAREDLSKCEKGAKVLNGKYVKCQKDKNEIIAKKEHYYKLWALRKADLKVCTSNNRLLTERLVKLGTKLSYEWEEEREMKKSIANFAAKFQYEEEEEEWEIEDLIRQPLPKDIKDIKDFDDDDKEDRDDGHEGGYEIKSVQDEDDDGDDKDDKDDGDHSKRPVVQDRR